MYVDENVPPLSDLLPPPRLERQDGFVPGQPPAINGERDFGFHPYLPGDRGFDVWDLLCNEVDSDLESEAGWEREEIPDSSDDEEEDSSDEEEDNPIVRGA